MHDVPSATSCLQLLKETCLPLSEIAARLPPLRGDKPPHRTTVYRWATKGRLTHGGERVRLTIIKVGGTNCTSLEEVFRFLARINGTETSDTFFLDTQAAAESQHELSVKILRHRGLAQ